MVMLDVERERFKAYLVKKKIKRRFSDGLNEGHRRVVRDDF